MGGGGHMGMHAIWTMGLISGPGRDLRNLCTLSGFHVIFRANKKQGRGGTR
jgi:hypothetical protein